MKTNESRYQIKDRCLRHMVATLRQTKPLLVPYPHFWTENILPEDIYDRILAELPDTSLYLFNTEPGRHYMNRGDMHLLSEKLDQLPDDSRELWYGIRLTLAMPELKQAIFKNRSAGFAHRFGIPAEEASGIEAYPRPMLYRETEGYNIAPHPDTRRKLATVQIALTDDPLQSDLGTSLYRLSAYPIDLLQAPRGFRRVARHPFTRNSMFAFSVVNTITMRSWHGREPLPAGCGIRCSKCTTQMRKMVTRRLWRKCEPAERPPSRSAHLKFRVAKLVKSLLIYCVFATRSGARDLVAF
jgi:hypothetical protein